MMKNLFHFFLAGGALAAGLMQLCPPSIAQNYGDGYGYNNGVKNGYGPAPTRTPSYARPGAYTFPSNYQPGLDRNLRYAPGSCSTYVNC